MLEECELSISMAKGGENSRCSLRSLFSGRIASCAKSLARTLELDVRSLAVFRILLGCTVLLNIKDRFREIPMHLTDDGWLPRKVGNEIRRIQGWRRHQNCNWNLAIGLDCVFGSELAHVRYFRSSWPYL